MVVLLVLAVLFLADAAAGVAGVSNSAVPVALLCAGLAVTIHHVLRRGARK